MVSVRAVVLYLLCLILAGCSGSQAPVGVTDPSGNLVVTQSNTFELQNNVKILPDETTVQVTDVQDGNVTLTGAVPTLQVGDVVARSEGNNQFLRRVTAITAADGKTVLQTSKVVMCSSRPRFTRPLFWARSFWRH